MYAKYNPFADTLSIECEVSREKGTSYFDYEPTADEAKMLKDAITEKIKHTQTPQEFCEEFYGDSPQMGGI